MTLKLVMAFHDFIINQYKEIQGNIEKSSYHKEATIRRCSLK